MTEQLLLTPEEAFQAIGVKRAKGYQMLANNELPSFKIGRLRKVPVDALHQWIAQRMRTADVEMGEENDAEK